MAVGDIVIKLDLDGKGFTSKIAIASRDIERFSGLVSRSSSVVQHQTGIVRTWGRTLRDTFIVFGLARAAFANVVAVIDAFPAAVIKANAELERMRALMISLDTTATDFASAAVRADATIGDLFDISSASPFEINAVTDAYVKLKAAGLDPMNGTLQGLLDSLARFGGSNEQLKRASIAIQQMAGKGVISMEELRQQLGEAIPNAMQVMARATGMEMSQMVKIISEGRLEAKSALVAFTRQLQIETSGAANQMSKTWIGTVNRLKNEWTLFLKEVGDAGAFQAMKDALNDLVSELRTNTDLRDFAQVAGRSLAELVGHLRTVIEIVAEWHDVLLAVGRVFLFTKALSMLGALATRINTVAGVTRAWAAASAVAATELKAVQAAGVMNAATAATMGTRVSLLTTGVRNLGVASKATSVFLGMMGRAVWAAIGPLGIIVGAIWAVTEAVLAYNRSQEKWARFQGKDILYLSEEEKRDIQERLDHLAAQKQVSEQEIADFERRNGTLEELEARRADAIRRSATTTEGRLSDSIRTLSEKKDELNEIVTEMTNLSSTVERVGATELAAAIADQVRTVTDVTEEELAGLQKWYQGRLESIKTEVANSGLDYKGQGVLLNERNLEAERDLLNASIDLIENKVQEQLEIIDSGSKEEQEIAQEKLEALLELQDRYWKLLNSRESVRILDTKGDEQEQNKFASFLLTLEGRLASTNAELEDAGKELAKFEALVSKGKWKVIPETEINRARALADELDSATEKLDAYKKATAGLERVRSQIDNLTAAVAGLNDRSETIDNPWIKMAGAVGAASQRVQGFKRELEEIRELARTAENTELQNQVEAILGGLGGLEESSQLAAARAGLIGLQNAIDDYAISIAGAGTAAEISYGKSIEYLNEYMNTFGYRLGPEAEAVAERYKQVLEEMRLAASNSIFKLAQDWQKDTENMSGIWAQGIDGMTDSLTDFIVEGKANFKSFLAEMTKMIVKFMLQKAISQFLLSFFPGAANEGGGLYQGDINAGGVNATTAALGAVVGPRGPMALKKYSKGGVAYSPQLAVFGEGDTPEAYVPLPDGRSIPVSLDMKAGGGAGGQDITVNVINQTGQQVEGQASQPKFDGERMIVDVVLSNLVKPGRLRDAIKGI